MQLISSGLKILFVGAFRRGVKFGKTDGMSLTRDSVEYSGGGILIFSYLILIHQCDTFGGLYDNQVEPRQLVTSEFNGCRFDGPPIARKRCLRVTS